MVIKIYIIMLLVCIETIWSSQYPAQQRHIDSNVYLDTIIDTTLYFVSPIRGSLDTPVSDNTRGYWYVCQCYNFTPYKNYPKNYYKMGDPGSASGLAIGLYIYSVDTAVTYDTTWYIPTYYLPIIPIIYTYPPLGTSVKYRSAIQIGEALRHSSTLYDTKGRLIRCGGKNMIKCNRYNIQSQVK